MTKQFTMVVDHWHCRGERGWHFLREHTVTAKVTAKRITVVEGSYKGKKFGRVTGQEIKRRGIHDWYRFSLKLDAAQATHPA